MGFDPRRWRPSSGSRPLTGNVEQLLAENEALRREVRSLRLQLEAFLQGEPVAARSWEPMGGPGQSDAATVRQPADAGASENPWASPHRARAGRSSWSSTGSRRAGSGFSDSESAEPQRTRVTVGSSHGLSADLLERWGLAMARHPRWQELRLGPPGGLRALEAELRRHWWNPALSLEQELDRRSPGLGAELSEALRGPHCRWRWAVRAAFALHGPRAPEWLSEEPLRVVDELLKRVQQLDGPQAGSAGGRPGTRTANTSGASAGRAGSAGGHAAGAQQEQARQPGAQRDPGRTENGSRQSAGRSRNPGGQSPGSGAGERSTAGSRGSGRRPAQAAAGDPRAQALALLGLEADATTAVIKRAYRRLAKAHHPDLGGDVEAFRRLDAAYRSLL